jgi:hypothetical protein
MSNNTAAISAAIPAILLLVLFSFSSSPSVTMAQQMTRTVSLPPSTAITPAQPLTPQELEQQNRLQNVIAATTRNLEQGQKQVDGIVYTPRWSSPNPVVWVEPNSLSVLFVYCLPGEFADSGQEILGGSDLEVLESYSLAVTNDLMVWFMVVENENENIRLPAAVGVVCASDANDVQARVLSPQEQQEINNIIQQFITIQNTQVTNIENVINIINNVTTNGTTTGPVTPPPPTNETGGTTPPTNETGGTTPSGNDTAGTRPPRGEDLGGGILDNATVAGEGRGGGEETSSREATTPPTNETGGGLLFPSPEVSPLENETLTTGDDEVTIPPTLGGGTATP